MTRPIGTAHKIRIEEELERRILLGLSCEWDAALSDLDAEYRAAMVRPSFSLRDMEHRLGYWSGDRFEICLSRSFVLDHSWDDIRDVLLHEIAHQFAEQVLGGGFESPHGAAFRRACRLLRADPGGSGRYRPLRERLANPTIGEEDRRLIRIRKLMALAESRNRHEAEAAMLKAHFLIRKYNVDLLGRSGKRDFISIFPDKPALRHPREAYHLSRLLQEYYFVEGIWVPAYVLEKEKMGRALEITGTVQNVEIAGYVFDFVSRFIDRTWGDYNRGKHLNRYRKTDYAVGVIEGFRSKLRAANRPEEKDAETRALVRIQDPLLEAYMAYKYPRTVTGRRRISSEDASVVADGVKQGKKLVIARGIRSAGETAVRRLPRPSRKRT